MILAAALFFIAQEVPAPAQEAPASEEIVVQATYGKTTMLFDKDADGKLHNCRIMISSGSQRRDTAACQATPVCYARTADQVTDCVEMTILETGASLDRPFVAKPVGAGGPQAFTLPQLVQTKPLSLAPGQAGPLENTGASRDTERQRVKLPPLPKPPSDGPVIRLVPNDTDTDTRSDLNRSLKP